MLKKIGYVIATLFEIALFAGAYVINYFTVRKLGMMRWVVSKNLRWEREYPVTAIKYGVIALLLVLAALIVMRYNKNKSELKKLIIPMVGVTLGLAVGVSCFLLISTTSARKAYYMMGMLFTAAALVQEIKTLIGLVVLKK